MAKSIDMTNGEPFQLLLRFTIPTMIGNLLHQVYSITDGIVVGKYLGGTALAAVGCTAPVIMLLAALMIGVNMGVGILISQHFGRKDYPAIRRVFCNSLYLGLCIAVALAVTGLLLTEPILRLMQTPEGTIDGAKTYLRINFLTTVFPLFYYLFSSAFRGIGDSQTALYCLIVSVTTNIVMDILFVTVFGWGVAGSAWATALAQGMSALFAALLLYKKYPAMRPKPGDMAVDLTQFSAVTRIAIPIACQSAFNNLGSLVAQSGVNTFQEAAMTAYTAAGRVGTLALLPLETVGSSISVFAAQNHGAGKQERIGQGIRDAQRLVLMMGITIGALLAISGRLLVCLFLRNPQAEVLDIVQNFLIITAVPGVLAGFMYVYQQTLRGVNMPNQALAGGVMQLSVKAALAVVGAWGVHNLNVIWLGWPLSFIAGAIVPSIYCRRYTCNHNKDIP